MAKNRLETKTPEVMALTRIEKIAMQGIQAREREIQQTVLKPFQEDFQEVLRTISERLGLAPGAFGTTHALNVENFTVTEMVKPEYQEAAAQPNGTPE